MEKIVTGFSGINQILNQENTVDDDEDDELNVDGEEDIVIAG